MEMKKAVYASLLLLALLLTVSRQEATSTAALDDEEAAAPAPICKTFGCDLKCSKRCENVHSSPWRCLKYCNLCCNKCKGCVPSGHYGNKDECPCYRDMKARSGKPKCP